MLSTFLAFTIRLLRPRFYLKSCLKKEFLRVYWARIKELREHIVIYYCPHKGSDNARHKPRLNSTIRAQTVWFIILCVHWHSKGVGGFYFIAHSYRKIEDCMECLEIQLILYVWIFRCLNRCPNRYIIDFE